MEILANPKFQLIKRDIRALKKHIIYNEEINNWTKIIILYNIHLIVNHIFALYKLMNYFINNTGSFKEQYIKFFLFFFLFCNLKNSYLYFILNVSKIDLNLANNLFKNSKEYFI
jgi:hypothetical protein